MSNPETKPSHVDPERQLREIAELVQIWVGNTVVEQVQNALLDVHAPGVHTLTPCSVCRLGYRPRNIVLGRCPHCAAQHITRLEEQLSSMQRQLEEAEQYTRRPLPYDCD